MDDRSGPEAFAREVIRYSALKYLQARVADHCRRLPWHFASLADWTAYRARLVDALRQMLPVWDLSEDRPAVVQARAPLADRLLLEAVDLPLEAGFCIPVHVYSLRGQAGRQPAVVVCPGYTQKKNDPDIVEMGMALARAGFVAVAVEYDGTGERADRPDPATDINNVCAAGQLIGITNVGLRVMTNLAVLRYLKSRADVDPRRIGLTGLCQGAIVTWYTAAVCEDFAAVAPLCGATTYEAIILEYCNRQGGWSGISPYVFGLLRVADVPHLVGAAAPRPLLVQNNLTDIHWPLSGFEKVKRFAQHIYGLYGREASCTFRLEHGPHAYAEPFVSHIVAWFRQVLESAGDV